MIQNDTTYHDSIASSPEFIQPEVPVLLNGEINEETGFPFSENLNIDLCPDWIFYFTIGMIALFAWIKLIYPRFTFDIIGGTVNYQLTLRLFNNANIVQKRISFIFSVFYLLSFSVYLFLLFEYFEYFPAGLQDFQLIISLFGFLLALNLFRTSYFRITGFVFKREKLFQEATFHNSLFNKLTGIVSLPFILIISYISEIYLDFVVYLSLFLLISVNVLRIIRGVKFVMKNVISYFYFILYLCSLEILPILVIIKVLHSL